MKRVWILAVVGVLACFLSSDSVSAKAAGKKADRSGKQGEAAKERFKKLDANGDGFLSLDEFKAGGKRKAPASEVAEGVFKSKDKNSDGKLSAEEFAVRTPEEFLLQYDANKDGVVTLDEFKAGYKPRKSGGETAEEAFKQHDKNGDSKLTKEDFQRKGAKEGRRAGKRGKKNAA